MNYKQEANIYMKLDDKMINKFYKIFKKQVQWDKQHNNLNSLNFADDGKNLINYISYMRNTKLSEKGETETLADALNTDDNLEDGKTYREDIKQENDEWFSDPENDPEPMDANYRKWIKRHQSHFNPAYMYLMASDIDFYTTPLTHLDVWNLLNGDYEKVHVDTWDALDVAD